MAAHGELDGVAPDFVEILVVFHDSVPMFEEGNEVGSLRGVADAAELRVNGLWVGRLDGGQVVLDLDGAWS